MYFLIAICFAVFLLCSCLFVAHFGRNWNLKPVASLSSGALLSLCFLDFLPHSFENRESYDLISLLILSGVLIQGLADIYILPHLTFLDKWLESGTSKKIHIHSHTLSFGSICSIAGCLSICSFFDGIRFFSSMMIKESVAFATAFGLFFHLLSEGVLVAVLALESRLKTKILFVLVFSLFGSFLLGALISQIFLLSFSPEMLIAFSSGILIYICFVHLLPFSLKQNNSLWFFAGLVLFSLFHFFV